MSSSFYSQIGIPSANSTAIESNVATSQTAATNSAASATNSASSASASAASATAANAADVSATQSKNAAEAAETNSAASATASATSATASSTSATQSQASAVTANTEATNAALSAIASTTQATNAAASATSAASSLAAIGTSVTDAATSATAAASTLSTFQNQYLGASATAPTADPDGSALDLGDLWFDSASDTLKVYAAGGWVNAGSSVNGTSERQTYTATAGQTTFAVTYDAGFVDCWMNGAKLLVGSDFTATSGTNIVLSSPAQAGDIIDIIAFGTFVFTQADHYTKTAADARFEPIGGGGGGYGDTSVDTHLNQSSATTGQYLKWNGSDYAWDVVPAGYADSDVNTHLNQSSATTGQYLKWNGSDYAWDTVAAGYTNSDVDLHLNQSSATTDQFLKWNGSDYAWSAVPAGVGGATGVDFNDSVKARFGTGNDLEIYHDAAAGHSKIADTGTGYLVLTTSRLQVNNAANNQEMIVAKEGDAVELFHNNSKKFETTATGVNVNNSGQSQSLLSVGGGSTNAALSLRGSTGSAYAWQISSNAHVGSALEFTRSTAVGGTTFSTPSMVLDSSGNVLVGKSASDGGVQGHEMRPTSFAAHTVSGGTALVARRLSDDGTIALFQYQGGDAGYIGTANSGDLYIGNSGTGVLFAGGSNSIIPVNPSTGVLRDNAIDLAHPSYRHDDIYATNGTIQTSDETEKQDIASLTSAEITAATAISKLFKTYKWKDKVTAKGDNARTHTGVVAQQVQTAMSDAGLNASNYAFWCSNTWWEKDVEVSAVTAVEAKDAVYDDDGNLVSEAVEAVEAKDAHTRTDHYDTKDEAPSDATERTRLGVRYPELLAFVGAATEQRLTNIETRLTALEAN